MPAIVIPAPNANVKKSDIINNLTSTSTTAPLSAAQGKALKDLIEQSTAKDNLDLSSKTAIATDVFTLTSGVYRCGASAPNLPVTGAGYMTVIYRANDVRYLEYMTDSGRLFTNTLYNGVWTGWKEYEDKQSTAPDTDVVLPWGNYKDAGTTYALSKSILTAHHIDVLAGYSNAGTNSGYSLAMIPKNLISAGNIFTIVYFTGNDIQHASFEIVDGTHIKIIACSETYLGIREIRAKYY